MTSQTKIGIAVLVALIAVIGAVVAYSQLSEPDPAPGAERSSALVRDDSHRLSGAKDAKVTLVEFLDLECEACGAAFPFVEQLRQVYDGRVTFVVRYFPLPSHHNSRNAAHAVESAARQGKFEEMYEKLFQTQSVWGESGESKAPLFRSYAEELGLDMAAYVRDVTSADVAERVQRDIDDGTTLGVRGTPTFFLNGELLEVASSEDFVAAIDQALAEQG